MSLLRSRAILVAVVAGFLITLLGTTAFAQAFQGTWQGYIQQGQLHRPYVFRITRDDHSYWAAGVIIDNDWGNVWKADSISIDGPRITFAIPPFHNSYHGQLNETADVIEGTWTVRTPTPLRMDRATPGTLWRETPHSSRFVTVEKNIKVEVLDWGGTGRPLVMLPGNGLTAHVFSQFAAKLTPQYHVYGITPRGFGASSAPTVPWPVFSEVAPNTYELKPIHNNPYDADQIGDDIIEVLKTMHIRRPVLVGHSIAGEYLTSVASRYPNDIAGLVFLDAFAEFAFSDGRRYDALVTDEHPMRITLPSGQALHLDVDDAVLLGMHEYRHFPKVPALAIFALPHHLQGLTGPALATFRASEQRAVDRMNRIRPLLPTVRILNFPNADHMLWESNEADVLRAMRSFIEKLPK